MKITITENEKAFANAAAWRIIGQILRKQRSVIGLSTGRTTGELHRTVAKIHKEYPFDVSEVTFFGQDEVVGVPREYFGSCWKMLKTELIDDIGTDDGHFLMLPVKSDDYSKDCKEFIEELESRGGIDLLTSESEKTATSASTNPARRSEADAASPLCTRNLRRGSDGRQERRTMWSSEE